MLNRRRAATGIDIGSRAVKLARVEEGPAGPRVTHWGHEAIDAGGPDRVRAASQALNRLLRSLHLGRRHLGRLAVAVGSPDVIVRQVNMPSLSETDLRRSLPFEARKHLPLESMPDAVLDFQILGPARPTNGAPVEGIAVLMVAAPRKAKEDLLDTLRVSGLEPDVIDIEPLPALNALLRSRGTTAANEDPVALVDLGGLSRVLAVALPGGEVYTRNLKVAGNPSSEGGEADVQHLIQEVADTMRFLNVRRRGNPIREIHLCGGASLSDPLRERLAAALGVTIRLPDPFAGLEMQTTATPAPTERACMVSAVGLALWWQE